MRLSIRWRLTLWITLALAVVLLCFAVLAYSMLRHALLEQVDRLLQAALGQLRNDPRAAKAPEERLHFWIEEYREHQDLLCVVYRPDGTLHASTPGLAQSNLPPLPASEQRLYNEQLPVTGRQRILAERLTVGQQELVILLLASLQSVDHELDEILGAFLIAGPITLLLSAGVAYALARKALAPVARIRRATNAITAERLDHRLAAPNPHDELGLLTQTINAMISRLERSFGEIRRFTADASHELRTPLTVLRMQVEVALGQSLSIAEHRRLLGDVLDELVRLSRLTDQLLMLSRRDAGVEQLASAPVNLHTLVAGVVEALQPLAESNSILLRLEGEEQVQVLGDESRLRQVVINLLDNALKYTPAHQEVTIQVSQQGGQGVVVVQDTGIGIAPEHIPHVFDRFYRVDRARTRTQGGTGLGLSIAQSVVLAHGGTIEMTSMPGQGTVCTVRLPCQGSGVQEAGGA